MTPAVPLDEVWLAAHRLPKSDGDKEDKGRLFIVGGSAHVPGALLLCGEAAMRSGAGKVQLATIEAVSLHLGTLFPEVAVLGLPMTPEGEIAVGAAAKCEGAVREADALLVGPAMRNSDTMHALVASLIASQDGAKGVVLDAGAIGAIATFKDAPRPSPIVLTPHCGEMASLMDIEKEVVEEDQLNVARRAADQFGATVVLKSASTIIAEPAGTALTYSSRCAGLGTAGSGDVLAGIIAALLAQGAAPLVAAAWGVWLHGGCGRKASRQIGPTGFLARDLPQFLPGLLPR